MRSHGVAEDVVARLRLTWEPAIGLADGIRSTVAWYREAVAAGAR